VLRFIPNRRAVGIILLCQLEHKQLKGDQGNCQPLLSGRSQRRFNLPEGKDADEYLHTYTSEHYLQLVAALQTDWQIEQIVPDKQTNQFQQVSALITETN